MAKVILFEDCKEGHHKKCKYRVGSIFCSCDCHKKEKIRPFETREQSERKKAIKRIIEYADSLDW